MHAASKFIVVLHDRSGAAAALAGDVDAQVGGLAAITCLSVDPTGQHRVVVVRTPTGMSPDGTGRPPQTWWFAPSDIAAVFQIEGGANPIGFAPGPA